VQVASPIVSFNLCIQRFNKWLGTLCMACCSYSFIQLIYISPPRAFILLNSLAFRIVIVCRCAPMIDNGSATLTNVSSSVTPTILNESMPLGAHAMLESPSPFLHHKPLVTLWPPT
jgi:hypothetical protein